jgi:hypothetical protein
MEDIDHTKHINGIVPTIFLRGIDPNAVINDYHNGAFINATLPTKKIRISGANLAHNSTNNDINKNDIFTFRERNNVSHRMVTTNCTAYNIYMQDGTSPTIGGQCKWCSCKFDHISLGVPIRLDIKPQLDNPKLKEYIFYIDAVKLCSFECAFAYIIKDVSKGFYVTNPRYTDARKLLLRMFDLMFNSKDSKDSKDNKIDKDNQTQVYNININLNLSFPINATSSATSGSGKGTGNGKDKEKEILIPAPDPELLNRNDGSISLAEYRTQNHYYRQTPNIICPPIKSVYEQTSMIHKTN